MCHVRCINPICILYASSASLLMECPFSKRFCIILDTYWKQHMEIRTQPACLAQHVHSSAGVSPLPVLVCGRVWGAGASLAYLPLVSEGQGTAPVSSRQTDIPLTTPVLQQVFQVPFRFFLAPSNFSFWEVTFHSDFVALLLGVSVKAVAFQRVQAGLLLGFLLHPGTGWMLWPCK